VHGNSENGVKSASDFFAFEPMKVPKNRPFQAKLMNKIFVKKKRGATDKNAPPKLFLVLALYM
jgi:hypothetical protein